MGSSFINVGFGTKIYFEDTTTVKFHTQQTSNCDWKIRADAVIDLSKIKLTTYKDPIDCTAIEVVNKTDSVITAIEKLQCEIKFVLANCCGQGGGTVTTVDAQDLSPLFTTVVNTPNTTPNIVFTQISQAANLVFASPNGAAGLPIFRSLVVADISNPANITSSDASINIGGAALGVGTVLKAVDLTANIFRPDTEIFWGTGTSYSSNPNFTYDDHNVTAGGINNVLTMLDQNTGNSALLVATNDGVGGEAQFVLTADNLSGTGAFAQLAGDTSGVVEMSSYALSALQVKLKVTPIDVTDPIMLPHGIFIEFGTVTLRGTASAGSTTTLTDSNAVWRVNEWVGYTLNFTDTLGNPQSVIVLSNTSTALTFALVATAPDILPYTLSSPSSNAGRAQFTPASFNMRPNNGIAYEFRFYDTSGGYGNTYVGFRGATTIPAQVMWTLPNTDSTGTQALVSDGAGNMSWSSFAAATSLVVGTTTITGGTTQRLLYDNAGILGEIAVGASAGMFLRSDGTSWGASTLILPNAATSSRVVFASAANTYGESANLTFATSTLTIGVAGAALGALVLTGNTSGAVTIQTAAAAGTWTLTLPTTDGASGEFLQTDGAGVTTWAAASGGGLTVGTTTIASGAATRVLLEGAGNVLQESANLTFTNPALTIGLAGSTTGQYKIGGATSGTAIITTDAANNSPTILLPLSSSRLVGTFDKSVTDVTHTGDTAETLMYSALIPANTLSAGQILRFQVRFRKTGVAAGYTVRTRFGTANDLTGTLMSTQTSGATTIFSQLSRLLLIKDATNFELIISTSSQTTDDLTNTTGVTSVTVDLTVANYFVISVQHTVGGSADTTTFSGYYLEIL